MVTGGSLMTDGPAPKRIDCEIDIGRGVGVPAFVYLFLAPRSATRQDVVEIYTVGSPSVLELVCKGAVGRGAVPALPGEFTARAFLLGALDLSAAEAVAGIVRAESDAQLRGARRLAEGTLNRRVGEVRDELAELLALIEAGIDFADEPIEFITPREVQRRLQAVASGLDELMQQSVALERLDLLPHVLLVGPPNAGKSSLMNRLSGTSRAICSAVAGTTRDLLSAPIRLGRAEAILLDSAGIDDSADEIILAAQAMTLAAASQVDLTCLVLDASLVSGGRESFVPPAGLGRAVVVLNKLDLLDEAERQEAVQSARSRYDHPVVMVSAMTGEGTEQLITALTECLDPVMTTSGQGAVLASERQRTAIADAAAALSRAAQLANRAAETSDQADLIALELREALDHLGMITGEVTTDELLGRVFSRFCIGK